MKNLNFIDDRTIEFEWDDTEEETFYMNECKTHNCTLEELFTTILTEGLNKDNPIFEVYSLAYDVFEEAKVDLWFDCPQVALEEKSPREVCNTEEGRTKVKELLLGIKNGLYQ